MLTSKKPIATKSSIKSSTNSTTKIYNDIDTCMAQPISKLKQDALKMNLSHITLDTQQGKVQLCQEISEHQQSLFTKNKVNPIVEKTLNKQEEDCETLCK